MEIFKYRIKSIRLEKMPVMKRRQMEGPAGGAGLIRYFDVDEGGPKLDPRLVISIVAAIIILEIISTLLLS